MLVQQTEAIAKLLGDDDAATVNLVKEQLIEKGTEASPELQHLLQSENPVVRRHVTQILAEIDARDAVSELTLLCPLFQEEGDIEHAAWLLARAMLPGVPVEKYKAAIDELGKNLTPLVAESDTAKERIGVIAAFLAIKHGFRGNVGDYYDANNSLLPSLLESHLGIPISLALLYILVGSRAGMIIEGVNLPGHFLARHDGILFDPYEHGRIVTFADCNEILARQNLSFSPSHIEAATPRAMFRRMLTNLLYIFQNDGDEIQAERLAGWINGLERA